MALQKSKKLTGKLLRKGVAISERVVTSVPAMENMCRESRKILEKRVFLQGQHPPGNALEPKGRILLESGADHRTLI
jgi:hypothetical protein